MEMKEKVMPWVKTRRVRRMRPITMNTTGRRPAAEACLTAAAGTTAGAGVAGAARLLFGRGIRCHSHRPELSGGKSAIPRACGQANKNTWLHPHQRWASNLGPLGSIAREEAGEAVTLANQPEPPGDVGAELY